MPHLDHNRLSRAKKEAKRLLAISKKNNHALDIRQLADAQAFIAQVKGYSSWHEMEALSKGTASPSAPADSAPPNAPFSFASPIGVACRLGLVGDGAMRRLPLLGEDPNPNSLTAIQWIHSPSEIASRSLLMDSLSVAQSRRDPRDFLVISACDLLWAPLRQALGDAKAFHVSEDSQGRLPAINPLDALPGARALGGLEMEYLLDLLCELCAKHPLARDALRMATQSAFRKLSDGSRPVAYQKGDAPEIDRAMERCEPNFSPSTWWAASDFLALAALPGLALAAQARATPTLADVLAELPHLEPIHQGATLASGADFLSALKESLVAAMKTHPHMASRTCDELLSAPLRALYLNLGQRAAPNGERMAAGYLWARKAAQRWLPALARSGPASQWLQADVGVGPASEARRLALKNLFERAAKEPRSIAIIDGLESLNLSSSPGALCAFHSDLNEARKFGHAVTVASQKHVPLLSDFSNLVVAIQSFEDGIHVVSIEDNGAKHGLGPRQAIARHRPSIKSLWLASPLPEDRFLINLALSMADPRAALAGIAKAHPHGSWGPRAGFLSGGRPWSSLGVEEQTGLAQQELGDMMAYDLRSLTADEL